MYERFTEAARAVIRNANTAAQECGHQQVGTEHILIGLSQSVIWSGHLIGELYALLRLDAEEVIERVRTASGATPNNAAPEKLPQTLRAKKVIELSMDQARSLHHKYVGSEHILLGLVAEDEGIAAQELKKLGVTMEDAREAVLCVHAGPPDENLTGYCRSLAIEAGVTFDSVKVIAAIKGSPRHRDSLLSIIRDAGQPAA